jgi:hypothetical protein
MQPLFAPEVNSGCIEARFKRDQHGSYPSQ